MHLGEISYSIYLVHAPLLIVVFGFARKLFDLANPFHAAAASVVAISAIIVAAQLAYTLIKVPGRHYLAVWLIGKRTRPLTAE